MWEPGGVDGEQSDQKSTVTTYVLTGDVGAWGTTYVLTGDVGAWGHGCGTILLQQDYCDQLH